MHLANTSWLKELIADAHEPPCVSIYLPLYRANPPVAENARRFRDQLDQVQASLTLAYPAQEVQKLIERIQSIATDASFWTGDRDGIAVFASPDLLRVIDLRQPVNPAVYVADSFHVKPLLRIVQSA